MMIFSVTHARKRTSVSIRESLFWAAARVLGGEETTRKRIRELGSQGLSSGRIADDLATQIGMAVDRIANVYQDETGNDPVIILQGERSKADLRQVRRMVAKGFL